MAAYVADLIARNTENIDHLFTPERLAIIDRADAEIEAGRFRTMEQVEERLAKTRAEWIKANPLDRSSGER